MRTDVIDHPTIAPIIDDLRVEYKRVAEAMLADPGNAKSVLDDYRASVKGNVTFTELAAAAEVDHTRLSNAYFARRQSDTPDPWSANRPPDWPQPSMSDNVLLRLADQLAACRASKTFRPPFSLDDAKRDEEIEKMRHMLGAAKAERDQAVAAVGTLKRELQTMTDRWRTEKGRREDMERRTVEDHEGVIWHDEPEPTFWDRLRGFFRGIL